jgi:AcrR family transcriptional regulator
MCSLCSVSGKPKKTRDRVATERRLIESVGAVLATEGFAGLGVNAVAAEAGADKVLIYRYFGGLEGLVQAYAASTDFWPSFDELVPDVAALRAMPPEDQVCDVMKRFLAALRRRPQTIEIMAWEVAADTPFRAPLEQAREQMGLALLALQPPENDSGAGETEGSGDAVDLPALTALLTGGLNYLLVRSRHTPRFNGVPLQDPAGWDRLESSMERMIRGAFALARSGPPKPDPAQPPVPRS